MSKRLCRHLMEESIDYARAEFLAKDRRHKSLETTTRYLAPAKNVHDRLIKVEIAGILGVAS
jgi:hypothetical protein